ncbi:MAG: DUF1638 domain-containing protein [Desulfobacteraceae bacterium]|nr:DUF1638 domain-containing protein [Desulfobacteraceae bacterium]
MFENLLGTDASITVMEIGLHLQPDRLRQALREKVGELEEPGATILLGYGLCGRALEGVFSGSATLVLPRVDDCVGVLLGSRQRHKQVLAQNPGTYFLEQRWLDTELNIFTQMDKGLGHITKNRRRQLIKTALQHYDRLVFLAEGQSGQPAETRCMELARAWDMAFERMETKYGLIKRLLYGPWNPDEFVIAPPGSAIPLF